MRARILRTHGDAIMMATVVVNVGAVAEDIAQRRQDSPEGVGVRASVEHDVNPKPLNTINTLIRSFPDSRTCDTDVRTLNSIPSRAFLCKLFTINSAALALVRPTSIGSRAPAFPDPVGRFPLSLRR